MAFDNPEYTAGLNAVNAATNRLGTEVAGVSTAVDAAGTRVAAIAAQLASSPSPADVSTAASQLQAHAQTLIAASDSLDVAVTQLNGIGADHVTPAPVVDPIPPVEPPVDNPPQAKRR